MAIELGVLRLKKPLPGAQTEFRKSRAVLPGFFAATGTGKTMLGADKVSEACFWAGCDGLVVTPDYKQSRRGPQEWYIPTLTPVAVDPSHPFNHNDQVITIYNNLGTVSKIWFATGMTPQNIWGASKIGIGHLDEVCLMDPGAEKPSDCKIFQTVVTRARAPMAGDWKNQIVVTGTPEYKDHWTYSLWGDPNRQHAERTPWWNMSIYENPYRSEESIWLTETAAMGDENVAKQLLYGQWTDRKQGELFKAEWFPRYDEIPEDIVMHVASWDTAGTKKEYSSYTVGQIWAVVGTDPPHYYILDMVRDQLEYGAVKEAIRQSAFSWKVATSVIEDKQTGQSAIQELSSEGMDVTAFNPGSADKVYRASQAAIACFEGRVHLPSQQYAMKHGLNWVAQLEGDLFRAPFLLHWDCVDALSQFILWAEENRDWNTEPVILSVVTRFGDRLPRSRNLVEQRQEARRLYAGTGSGVRYG
jgi:predicted phage terminase large subunit-like protein